MSNEDNYEAIHLKPCPFCGGQAEIRKSGKSQNYIACEDCDSYSQLVHAVKEDVERLLVEVWNKRV